MNRIKFCALLTALLGLTACSTMTQKECLVANWSDLGFADGASGYTMTFFNERAGDCAKHGIAANRQAYLQARQAGLKTYCTKDKGYEQGYNGRPYHGVCQGKSANRFLSGYNKGKRIYDQKSQVDSLERDIRYAERDIADYRDEQYSLENQIVNENDKGKRATLVLELNRISREINRLKSKKENLLQQYKTAQKQLNALPQ